MFYACDHETIWKVQDMYVGKKATLKWNVMKFGKKLRSGVYSQYAPFIGCSCHPPCNMKELEGDRIIGFQEYCELLVTMLEKGTRWEHFLPCCGNCGNVNSQLVIRIDKNLFESITLTGQCNCGNMQIARLSIEKIMNMLEPAKINTTLFKAIDKFMDDSRHDKQ